MSVIRSLIAGSIMVGLAGAAHASVSYDNLNDTPNGNYFAPNQSSNVGYAGEEFTASSTTVADVLVSIAGDNTNDGGAVTFTLWDDAGGPNNELATLGTVEDTSLPDGYATTLYDLTGGATGLTPGNQYWVVMQDTGDDTDGYGGTSIVWFTASDDGGIGVAGGNYLATDGNLYANSDQSTGPAIMCVTSSRDDTCPAVPVTSTPEPAGLGIIAVAMLGLGAVRIGRRRL